MTNNLDIFRKDANTWAQRKDGIPLNLLYNLSIEELKLAETELIKAVSIRDDWPFVGLGHIKSKDPLPTLINLSLRAWRPLLQKAGSNADACTTGHSPKIALVFF